MNDFWNAESYSKNSSIQYEKAKKFILNYPFNENDNVLDIGCGDGRITYEIANTVLDGRVIGIDNSKNMIEFAQKNYIKSNLEFKLKDAEKFTLSTKFDVIVSFSCLHWIINKEKVFYKIKRHLKKKGRLRLLMVQPNIELFKICESLIKSKKWNNYFKEYPIPLKEINYYPYLYGFGFDDAIVKEEKITTSFDKKSELIGYLRNISPCLLKLPDECSKDEFMEDFFNSYNKLEVTYTYIYVSI